MLVTFRLAYSAYQRAYLSVLSSYKRGIAAADAASLTAGDCQIALLELAEMLIGIMLHRRSRQATEKRLGRCGGDSQTQPLATSVLARSTAASTAVQLTADGTAQHSISQAVLDCLTSYLTHQVRLLQL